MSVPIGGRIFLRDQKDQRVGSTDQYLPSKVSGPSY